MAPKTRPVVLCSFIWMILKLLSYHVHVSYATETDIECLKGIKESLEDPQGSLKYSWDFANRSQGAICTFSGVECWHPDESRVINLKLSGFGLKGPFPTAVRNCTSLNGLDLSDNNLSGLIPPNLCTLLLTSLVLSNNHFTGAIPANISNCTFLHELQLDHNQFDGQIPPELSLLGRLKTFNVANNNLYGPVPQFSENTTITKDTYANNPGLCGGPLDTCVGPPAKAPVGIIVGSVGGGMLVLGAVVAVVLYYTKPAAILKRKDDDPEGNRWAKSMKGTKRIKVAAFENTVSKMSLSDLMIATDQFSNNNIIGTRRTGTLYKAMMADGSVLTVKRLQESHRSEKEFLSEMQTLGSVKHRNLVPLLGFCMAKKERFLVYEYMAKGNLFDQLHAPEPEANMLTWPVRLKIAIGASRGLAWLHHNCNPRIIHRNISSKCILLNEDFEPKLSDFGLARLMNPVDTHLSTFVNGEFGDLGYVAPEYSRTLVATPKGDVYSFGTVLMELVTGERPTHAAKAPDSFKGNLVEWIWHLSELSSLHLAIDKSLLDKEVESEVFQFLKVACNCVSSTAKERPTMFEVHQLLRAIGQRYHFTADDDEITVPSNSSDANIPDELIVAME